MSSESQTRVEKAWPKIDAAVQRGLQKPTEDHLSAVVSVVAGSADLATHVGFSWGAETGHDLKARKLHVEVECIHELRTSKPVPYSKLDPQFSADADVLKWAKDTRALEGRWAIEQIKGDATASATPLDSSALDAVQVVDDKGLSTYWRLVALQLVPDLAGHCKQRNIEYVDATSCGWKPAEGVALLYPCDKFAMSRLEPFALSWEPNGTAGIQLRLAERVQLVGFTGVSQPDVMLFTAVHFPAEKKS